jgi:hypothetical protein
MYYFLFNKPILMSMDINNHHNKNHNNNNNYEGITVL